MRLEQNAVYAGSRGILCHMLIGIAGDKDNRCRDILLTEADRHIQSIHVGQLVIDHQAIDIVRVNGSQKRHGGAEGADLEAMGFEKKSQRLKHGRIVIENADFVRCDCEFCHLTSRIPENQSQ